MKHARTCVWLLLPTLFCGLGCSEEGREHLASAWQGTRHDRPNPQDIKDAPRPRIAARTHLAAGRMLERQNDLLGAAEQYRKALDADPELYRACNRLGTVYLRLRRFDEAEEVFWQGIHINPSSTTIHNNLGFCYLEQQRYREAEGAFRAALKLSPRFQRARMNLAITLARTERFEESAAEFSRVVPGEVAFYNVAVLCVDMKHYRRAEQALRQALAVNPDYLPAKQQITAVSRLAQASSREEPAQGQAAHRPSAPADPASDAPAAALAGHASDDETHNSP